MTLVKVLMIFKWSFMTGIDDNFVGGFLILVNVGFLSLSQLARHWLGSMYESQEFHMLSGKIFMTIGLFSWCLLVVLGSSPFQLPIPIIENAYCFDKESKLCLRLIWVLKIAMTIYNFLLLRPCTLSADHKVTKMFRILDQNSKVLNFK